MLRIIKCIKDKLLITERPINKIQSLVFLYVQAFIFLFVHLQGVV